MVVQDLRRFFRRFARTFGRQPIIAVIERGELGRWHVHFATARFSLHKKMARCWGHGFVWVGDDKHQNAKLPVRALARYLAKYLAKQIQDDGEEGTDERAEGGHRYLLAQGFTPLCFRRVAFDEVTALRWIERHYGLPDVTLPWADANLPGVHGLWLSYPDAVIARWLTTA